MRLHPRASLLTGAPGRIPFKELGGVKLWAKGRGPMLKRAQAYCKCADGCFAPSRFPSQSRAALAASLPLLLHSARTVHLLEREREREGNKEKCEKRTDEWERRRRVAPFRVGCPGIAAGIITSSSRDEARFRCLRWTSPTTHTVWQPPSVQASLYSCSTKQSISTRSSGNAMTCTVYKSSLKGRAIGNQTTWTIVWVRARAVVATLALNSQRATGAPSSRAQQQSE